MTVRTRTAAVAAAAAGGDALGRVNVQARAIDPCAHDVWPSGLARRVKKREEGEEDKDDDDDRPWLRWAESQPRYLKHNNQTAERSLVIMRQQICRC